MLTGFWHLWFLWKLFGEWPGSGSRWGLWRQKKWQIEKEGDREREETLIQVVPAQIQSILCQKLSKSPKYLIYSLQIIINIREGGGRGGGGVGWWCDIYDQWNNLVHRASKTEMAEASFRLRSVLACMIACMIEVKAEAGKEQANWE